MSEHITKHNLSNNNRLFLRRSQLCGCFYCLQIFQPRLIQEWCDDGETALCPHCRIDSIIPVDDATPATQALLEKMFNHWFHV